MSSISDFLNYPLTDVLALRRGKKTGDLFGVELECEGRNVSNAGAPDALLKHWEGHEDGSLRNNHGQSMEWVFRGPVDLDTSKERVKMLFKYFEARKARLVTSNRTSTHVHFNMADKRLYQVANLFILFTIFDDILDTYCGEDRKGNLFCLSSRYAEDQVRMIREIFEEKQLMHIPDNMRYTSLNLAALPKFGSVEFRGMRGLDNAQDIIDWLDILNDLCHYACYEMRNPANLLEQISVERPINILKKVFSPDNFAKLTKDWNEEQITASVYEGLRIVQPFCYNIGAHFNEVKIVGKDFWAEQGAKKSKKPPVLGNLDFGEALLDDEIIPRQMEIERARRAFRAMAARPIRINEEDGWVHVEPAEPNRPGRM